MKQFILVFSVWFFSHFQVLAQDSSLAMQLKGYISFLASDSLKGRFAGTHEGRMAANYIAGQMKLTGLQPAAGFDGFFNPFLYRHDTLRNIIGAIQGSSLPNEVIILSAHYDHVGTRFTNPYPDHTIFKLERKDSIYNGANDNASGTASLLALAKLIKSDSTPPARTILFIAFDGEELGEIGSNFLVDYFNPEKIYVVINLEMLGIPTYGSPFVTGDEFSNLREVLNKTLYNTNPALYGKSYFKPDNDSEQNLFSRSDNFPFAQRKIIAHTIMATNAHNQFYHSVKDEPATLNYTFMQEVLQAIHLAIMPLLHENIKLKGKSYLAK